MTIKDKIIDSALGVAAGVVIVTLILIDRVAPQEKCRRCKHWTRDGNEGFGTCHDSNNLKTSENYWCSRFER